MDQDHLVSDHFPYLPIRLRVRQGSSDFETEALLDTGFTGELIIPQSLIAYRPSAHMRVRLGDNSEVVAPVYIASFNVGPFGPISATALALGDEMILGVGVMNRFTITLDHAHRLVVEA